MTYDLAWLTNPAAKRCILVEAVANVAGTETTFYLSDKGYVTGAGDTPANTVYMPVIAGGVNVSEAINLDGSASLSYGDIELYNVNGERDDWLSYIWTNRAVSVYIGDLSWARADFQLIFNGIISDLDSKSVDRINIKIVDKLQRLNTPVTEVKLGGITENAYDILPLTFGEVFNVTPLLTNPATLEYQVHNGPIERIIEVRDNGVPLSAYTTSLSTGKFTLTAAPAGVITASVQGYKATTYINTIAAIIQVIVLNYGKASTRFVSNDLDLTNLSAFEAAHTQAVGIYLTDRVNVINVIQELAYSIGAVVVMSRLGKLQLLQINIPPTGTPIAITTADIVESSLRIVERLEVKSSSKIGYCKNWTVQENLQTGIPDEHKKMLSNEYLIVTQSNNTTSTAYKLDEEPVQRNTLLLSSIDAGTESLRDIAINTSVRTVYGFDGFSQLMLLKLGDTITLTNPRFGLSSGKLGTVIKLEPDWINSTVYVEALCSVDILTADITAPSAPSTLTVVASSPTTARFDWIAATDNIGVVGYNIYSGGALYAFLGNVIYYNAIGLTPATQYQFTVKARDKAGNIGAASNTVTLTMPDNSVDFAISDLTASSDGSLTATIINQGTIDYPGGEVAPYVAPVVWYKNNVFLNDSQLITPLARGDETIVTESGVKVPIVNGTYTIKATINEAGDYTGEINPNGTLSKTITISGLDTTNPTTPTNLVATPVTVDNSVTLTWTASTDDTLLQGYIIYEDEVNIASVGTVTTFSVSALSTDIIYSFKIQAIDAEGNLSAFSNIATAIIPSGNIILNGTFASSLASWSISQTGTGTTTWDPTGKAKLQKTTSAGSNCNLYQEVIAEVGASYNFSYTISGLTGSAATTWVTLLGTDYFGEAVTDGTHTITATASSVNVRFMVLLTDAGAPASFLIDDVYCTKTTSDITAPTIPTNLIATVISDTQINLTWTASYDASGMVSYTVFNYGSQIATGITTNSYNNTGLTQGTTLSYTVKAYDPSGNISAASSAAVATTTSTATFVPGARYVAKTGSDSNTGLSVAQAYLTIGKAVSMGANTIYVRAGTYQEMLVISTANVRLLNYPNEQPFINGNFTIPSSDWQALVSISAANCVLEGFKVGNTKTGIFARAIQMVSGSSGSRVSKCEALFAGDSGILAQDTTNVIIEECYVHDNVQSNVNASQTVGFTAQGMTCARCSYSILRKNNVTKNWGEGLSTYNSNHMTVEDNVAYNNWTVNLYLDSVGYSTIQRNMVYTPSNPIIQRAANNGLWMADETTLGTDNVVINNYIKGYFQIYTWSIPGGAGLKNSTIAFNTVDGQLQIGSLSNSNSVIRNNISILAPYINSASGLTFSNNCWPTIPAVGYSAGTDVIGNPGLRKIGATTAGDMVPQYFDITTGSICENKGVVVALAPADFYSKTRANPPDIGGYEI